MPPKYKFTKDEIINASLQIVSETGYNSLTARNIAKKLGSSTKVIFGLFDNMQALQQQVISTAKKSYEQKILYAIQNSTLKYKATGIAYITFAKENSELFKMLFMRDRNGNNIVEDDASVEPILHILQKQLNISLQQAKMFHLEAWVYVHGIATMIATGYLSWDEQLIDKVLTDFYQGLKSKYISEGLNDTNN